MNRHPLPPRARRTLGLALPLLALGFIVYSLVGPWLPGPLWMLIKMTFFILIAMWVRATLPRIRYDKLMSIGWKVLLPAATLNLLVTSAIVAWRA